MKKIHLLIGVLIGMFSTNINAQKLYDIRLEPMSLNIPGKVCYEIQLNSITGQELNLAGQNYRLYYDAALLKFNSDWSLSNLSTDDYTEMTVTEELYDLDATGGGELEYEAHLGFVNFSMDLKNISSGGIILDVIGTRLATAQICFDLLEEGININSGIHWARANLTAGYATAFVEVSEWVNPNKTCPAFASEYHDIDQINSTKESKEEALKIYPNPTSEYLSLEINNPDQMQLEFWDSSGKEVLRLELEGGASVYQIDLSKLPSGTYTLLLRTSQKIHSELIEKIY